MISHTQYVTPRLTRSSDTPDALAEILMLQGELRAAMARRTAAAEQHLRAHELLAAAAADLDHAGAVLDAAEAEVKVREHRLAEKLEAIGARRPGARAADAAPPEGDKPELATAMLVLERAIAAISAEDEPPDTPAAGRGGTAALQLEPARVEERAHRPSAVRQEPAFGVSDVSRNANQTVPLPVPGRAAEVGRFPRSTWLVLYTFAIIGPLILARASGPPHRSFAAELGSSLGIVALSLLALQLVLPARLRLLAPLGADVAVRLHRRLADVTVALIVAHVAVVVLARPDRVRLLAFVGDPWRAQAAVGSVVALGSLYATAMLRRRVRMSYASWRGLHTFLGAAALLLALAHTIGVGRYLGRGIAAPGLAGLILVALGAIAFLRFARPRTLAQRPYFIERVISERGGATTLELRADGHDGQAFQPGQFAWLKLADTTYGLAEHPFSYSSSAQFPARPSFTIKAYEGFSADVAWAVPGTRLIVDGPHGAYRPAFGSRGILLVAGGIGITPCMSILRTAADRGDRREFVLVIGSRTADEIIFREALEKLRSRLKLRVIPVLSKAPPEWTGERGYVGAAVLRPSSG